MAPPALSQLTPGEQTLFINAMLCATNGLRDVKVDFDQLAEAQGYKSKASASVMWGNLRRKVLSLTSVDGGEGGAGPSPQPSPSSKKGAAAAAANRVTKSKAASKAGKAEKAEKGAACSKVSAAALAAAMEAAEAGGDGGSDGRIPFVNVKKEEPVVKKEEQE
ncbi:hypothetical protein KEM52_001308 [Ascosphaera acerosa]|nr:hypothetical protein KEM52_001308 [Ascosphaera acerosa]